MASSHTHQAVHWMDSDSQAATLLATAGRLIALEKIVASCLPPALRKGFAVTELQDGELTLTVFNAAFAAKIRQLQPRLVQEIALAGHAVRTVRIRVSASAQPPPSVRPPKEARALDDKDLLLFEGLSTALRPGPLVDAIQKLIERHRKP
jgi:hypothetical protein